MEKISDYELMRKVSLEEDEWSKIQLWHRYQPVVHKRANYLMTIVSSRWEKDDLIQEFFLAFLKTIDYIDMEKIPDESFHFGTLFFFFLRKVENRIKIQYFRSINVESESYDNLFEGNSNSQEDSNNTYGTKASNTIKTSEIFQFDESSVLFNAVELPSFRKILTRDQNNILTDLLEKKKIVDISDSRNQKYSHVYKIIKEIRMKAHSHFVGVN